MNTFEELFTGIEDFVSWCMLGTAKGLLNAITKEDMGKYAFLAFNIWHLKVNDEAA